MRLRLARLPEEARALARAASVLGDGALLEDAAATAGLEPAEAAAAAGALVEVELLRARDAVAFVHPVVRGAVHASLGPLEQREAHARAARQLAAAGRPPEQVAAHMLECQPAGEERVVEILRAAAGRSLADGCADLAAAYLRARARRAAGAGAPRRRPVRARGCRAARPRPACGGAPPRGARR